MEKAALSKLMGVKAMAVGAHSYFIGGGDKWQPPKSPLKHYVKEGYQGNPVVYRSIEEIAVGASKIEIELFRGDEQIEQHPLLDLLKQPNPMQSFDDFIGELVACDRLFGEQFIHAPVQNSPRELWIYDPQEMQVKKSGVKGMPGGFKREVRVGKYEEYTPEEMLMRKRYNPKDCWRGQSPIMAVALQGDTFNEGSKWNYGLLKNSAAPSGLITIDGDMPKPEAVSRLRQMVKSMLSGPVNAGEVPVTSKGTQWVPLSHNPKDMDFATTMDKGAKYIASALGVPLPLVDNDASTFNNLEQAKERLYTDTIIPLVSSIVTSLNSWLVPMFEDGLELRLNMDSIPALEGLRQKRYDRALAGYREGVLTLQEARELMGYEPDAKGDLKPVSPMFNLSQSDTKSRMIEEAKRGEA